MSSIIGNIAVGMWSVTHPEYVFQKWHVFVAYLIGTWMCCLTVLFANRALPAINNLGLVFILGGVFITILVCAIMPTTTGSGHATNHFVWSDWTNLTGYSHKGFVFLMGMLNGAFAVGTPDCVSHLAEEIPSPRRNVPLAMAAQMIIGFITALFYMIAIFYAITNLDAVLSSDVLPLATIYHQATSSRGGTIGLLLIIILPVFCTTIGTYITAGRTLWTLARDDATPYSAALGRISPRFKNPFNATLTCGCISTVLGCIYVGSSTAFNAFVGSFIVLSTLSYLAAILPFVLTGRFSSPDISPSNDHVERGNGMIPGPFRMGSKVGYTVNIIACVYIVVFIVIYLFPFSLPVEASNMNYSVLITGAATLAVGAWWMVRQKKYVGPQALGHAVDEAEMRNNVSKV
jgi:choline transport protein